MRASFYVPLFFGCEKPNAKPKQHTHYTPTACMVGRSFLQLHFSLASLNREVTTDTAVRSINCELNSSILWQQSTEFCLRRNPTNQKYFCDVHFFPSNCFTRWVGILSRTSLGSRLDRSTWCFDRQPTFGEAFSTTAIHLTKSGNQGKFCMHLCSHSPSCPQGLQHTRNVGNLHHAFVNNWFVFVVLFADKTSRKHVSLLVES